MADTPRIEALRRRVEKDPSSIAFAQLAEEYRRSGDNQQAVKVCREGLARHPGYLSAQVTFGRALIELEEYDEARKELEAVLQVAPDNLAAIRALADIHQRHGEVAAPIDVYVKIEAPEPEQPAAEPEPAVALDVATELEPLPELEMPPLEDAPTVDLSLDASMPTFEDAGEAGASETGTRPPSDEDLPSIEALESLTLNLPPLPDVSNFTLDTELALDLPEPTFADPGLDQLETPPVPGATDDPVLAELQHWLAAIVADRSQPR